MSTTDTRNYYERELDLIDFAGTHPAKILIGCEGKVTRTLDVNRESAAAIVSKLCSVFFVDLTLANTMKPAPLPACSLKFGRDANGNKTVKIKGEEGRGFSIQTNGNLPHTHRDNKGDWDEIKDYVRRHGTAREKRIMFNGEL